MSKDFWLGWWGTVFFSGGWLYGFWLGNEHPNWPEIAHRWIESQVTTFLR